MLDLLLAHLDGDLSLTDLRGRLAAEDAALRETRQAEAQELVRRAEDDVRRDPAGRFSFGDDGSAVLEAAGHRWGAGHFQTVSVGALRGRIQAMGTTGAGRARLVVLAGVSPLTDIGAMQATPGAATLFQVASQFNCLESPGPSIQRVARYFTDSTQGPRASVSAFPAIAAQLLRAAYTGTLAGAIALGCTRVVLTQIGGGVFRNPPHLIWRAILDAFDDAHSLLRENVDVILNAHRLPPELDLDRNVLPEVRRRNGAIVRFEREGVSVVS
jgi:hypothetical protein